MQKVQVLLQPTETETHEVNAEKRRAGSVDGKCSSASRISICDSSSMRALVDQGVIEITLLGQNVNAYGVEFGDRGAFAKLLREAGKIDGLDQEFLSICRCGRNDALSAKLHQIQIAKAYEGVALR